MKKILEDGTMLVMKNNGHLFAYLKMDEDFLNKKYVASYFYKNEVGCVDCNIEARDYDGRLALVFTGTQVATGLCIEDFFWPRNELTAEEKKQILEVGVADFKFTFGCHESLTPDGPVLQFAANKFREVKLADGTIIKGGKKLEFVPKNASASAEAVAEEELDIEE